MLSWRVVLGATVLGLAPFAGCSSSSGTGSPATDAGGTDGTSHLDGTGGEAAPPAEAGGTESGADVGTESGADANAETGVTDAGADVQGTPACTVVGFDPTFGTAGTVQRPTPPDPVPENGHNIALQADGKILVAGISRANGAELLVARYGTDGSPDTTFGTGGIVTLTPSAGTTVAVGSIVVQPDAKILVSGTLVGGAVQVAPFLLRLGAAGALDTTFGTAGYAAAPATPTNAQLSKLLLRPNGSIVVLGGGGVPTQAQYLVAQYTASGVLDTTFGTGGVTTTALAGTAQNVVDALLQPDGLIVAAGGDGYHNDAGGYTYLLELVRYTTSGSLDTGFGTGGITSPPSLGTGAFYVISVARQSTGAIVAALYTSGTPSPAFYVLRYTPTGQLDTSFGTSGIARAPFPATPTYALHVDVLAGDALLVTGVATATQDASSSQGLGIARFTAGGSLDTTFGNGGTMMVTLPAVATATATVQQPDQQVVVAATSTSTAADGGTSRSLDLARYCP